MQETRKMDDTHGRLEADTTEAAIERCEAEIHGALQTAWDVGHRVCAINVARMSNVVDESWRGRELRVLPNVEQLGDHTDTVLRELVAATRASPCKACKTVEETRRVLGGTLYEGTIEAARRVVRERDEALRLPRPNATDALVVALRADVDRLTRELAEARKATDHALDSVKLLCEQRRQLVEIVDFWERSNEARLCKLAGVPVPEGGEGG